MLCRVLVYASVLFLLLAASVAYSTEVVYQEPSTKESGGPIDDLAAVRLALTDSEGAVLESLDFAASSPSGGQTVTQQVSLDAVPGEYLIVAYAVNEAGAQSAPSPSLPITIPDVSPPAAPTILRVVIELSDGSTVVVEGQ